MPEEKVKKMIGVAGSIGMKIIHNQQTDPDPETARRWGNSGSAYLWQFHFRLDARVSR